MSLKAITEFFKDLFEYIKKIFTSRIIPFVIVMIAVFSVLIYRLFCLQIVNGESYTNSYTMKTQRTVTTTGPRGNIYDRNGVLLAYSELAYSVVIEDCGYYDSTKVKNKTLNNIIANTIDIIEKNGDSIDYNFDIDYTDGKYAYNVEGNTLLRFLRDIYGKTSVNELSEEQKNSTADDVVEYFASKYQLSSQDYSDEMILDIIYVRYNLNLNSYKRYISFTIAENVSETTMAAVLENSSELVGVGIEEEYVRKYNYAKYISHIVGYTGKISESELETLQQEDSSYTANDIVGKSGIEQVYETTLAGKKGSTTMLVDNVGRVQEITDEVEATVGNDVYLTIDVELQKKIYDLMERRLAEILETNIVNSDETRAGIEDEVVLPITKVYAALIDNNILSMDEIKTSETDTAKAVYGLFYSKLSETESLIEAELESGTIYNNLSDNMKSFVKQIRSILIDEGIIDSDKISSDNEIQTNWQNGDISLRDYIFGAINNEWVDISSLDVSGEYPTEEEVYKAIEKFIINEIYTNSDLEKIVYDNLITSHVISGQQICLLAMEQNVFNYTETEYVQIQNGGSPFSFIMGKIHNLELTPAQLALDPCSGSCVLEDTNSGELLAMVSYPGYDINKFSGSIDSEYYNQLLNDKSTPLVNRATQTKIAPGSTYKPCTSIAALTEGAITENSTVYCSGIYDEVVPSLKCAIYPGKHGDLDVRHALLNSCNVFFCHMGYLLSTTPSGTISHDYGLSRLKKYSDMLGLSTKSGIQIPEATPKASDFSATASGIGQGTHAYTSLNLARYVSTIANKGTVYNSNLIYKIAAEDGTVISESENVVANTCDTISDTTWTAVQEGMGLVISNGIMNPLASRLPVTVYGKSGTAEEDKNRGSHGNYIMFTKDSSGNSDVAVAVMIPYGYAATNAGIMAYYALSSYYDVDIPETVLFDVNNALTIKED